MPWSVRAGARFFFFFEASRRSRRLVARVFFGPSFDPPAHQLDV
jgi:hypothetical protein